jgi:hypothetical protein
MQRRRRAVVMTTTTLRLAAPGSRFSAALASQRSSEDVAPLRSFVGSCGLRAAGQMLAD